MKCVFKKIGHPILLKECDLTIIPRKGEMVGIKDIPYVVVEVFHDYDQNYIGIFVKYADFNL